MKNVIREEKVPSLGFPYMYEDPYALFLMRHRNKLFHVKAYGGNSGDELIKLGTNLLLRDLHIKTTLDPREADVILWPGGNGSMWPSNVNMWASTTAKYPNKSFVVGPSTFRICRSLWPAVIKDAKNSEKALFARDQESYSVLTAFAGDTNIQIGLSHDPAFYLRDSEWLDEQKRVTHEEHILVAFRGDFEGSLFSKRFVSILDRISRRSGQNLAAAILGRLQRRINERKVISKKIHSKSQLLVSDVAIHSFDIFMEYVRNSIEVHTDRLHVALISTLLGKKVFAYETAYGKLQGVIQHTLGEDCVANIKFLT